MARTARGQDPVLSPWLRRLSLAALALYLALALYVLWRAAVLTPYADQLDWIARWRELQSDHDWARYLLTPINLHRIVWTLGLIAMDIQAFGGTNAPLILSGALSLAAMAWMLGREAARAAPAPLAPPAAAVAAMLTLMAGNILDASTPINVDYTHGAVFAVLAIIIAEGRPSAGLSWRGATALLCAMASALGDAAGLAVWPVLALGALRRRDWAWLAAVLVTGMIFVGLYASGQGEQTHDNTLAAFRDPIGAARLTLSFLMLPWTRLSLAYAWIGGLLVALGAAAALVFRSRAGAPRAERVACGLILFTLGTAAMAGLGRSGLEDPANVPLRYAVFLAPLHVGFLILALPYAGMLWRANRRAAQVLMAAIVVLLSAQNAVMSIKVIRAGDVVRTTLVDFRDGRRTQQMRIFVHPDLARAAEIYAGLQRDNLFQHELHLNRPRPAR